MGDERNKRHAEMLAANIKRFWAARGFYPRVWIEEKITTRADGKQHSLYSPRSDLIDGYPVGWPKRLAVRALR